MEGLGGWAPAPPALFRTTPDMTVLWDAIFNSDGTGVGTDEGGDGVGVRGKVIVGRGGTVSEPGSIFVRDYCGRNVEEGRHTSRFVWHVLRRRPQISSRIKMPQGPGRGNGTLLEGRVGERWKKRKENGGQ